MAVAAVGLAALALALARPVRRNAAGPAALPPHPRLYLDASRARQLGDERETVRRRQWAPVARWLDTHRSASPPEAISGDFRRVGEAIPYAALGYLLTGDTNHLALARRYLLGVARYPHWGDDHDIEAAHLLYGLAVGYDWLHDALPEPERRLVAGKLALQARRMRPLCGRRHPPLNNHNVVCLAALGVAGLALYGECDEAAEWVAHARRTLQTRLDRYGTDGASTEGVSYWSYATEYLLKFATPCDALTGSTLLRHPWLRQAAQWPLHLSLPASAWAATNQFVNLADSPRFCWYGPHPQLYRLASCFGQPEAQWLADALQDSGFSQMHADWLAILWYDPRVSARPPPAEALTKVFDHYGRATMRSGWGGDDVLGTFSCGPAGGVDTRLRWPWDAPGGGHAHPDANAFTIVADGAWLAADDGAAQVKRTAAHNTVLVNGVGQVGEGGEWFDHRAQGRLRSAPVLSRPGGIDGGDYFVGDASGCYRPEAGLRTFRRHFVYLRPRLWVVVDELAARDAASFEWRLHTPGRIALSTQPGRAVVREGRGTLQVVMLQPEGVTLTAEAEALPAEHLDLDWRTLNVLRAAPPAPVKETLFVTVLYAVPPGQEPLDARLDATADGFTLTAAAGDLHHALRLRRSAHGLALASARGD